MPFNDDTKNEKPFLIISGSGRSGTTWVLDVVCESNGLKPVFEPLHPDFVKQSKEYSDRYVRPEMDFPELKKYMNRLLSGRSNNIWTKYRIPTDELTPTLSKISHFDQLYRLGSQYKTLWRRARDYRKYDQYRFCIKFIRANLMLTWLATQFHSKIVLLVRHPGAVVSSKINRPGEQWDFHGPFQQRILRQYRTDERFQADFLHQYDEIFDRELSEAEGHTILWCLENALPMKNAAKYGIKVVFYEKFLVDPVNEFNDIIQFFELKRKPDISLIHRPSQQASKDYSATKETSGQLTNWANKLSEKQLSEIDNILSYFQISVYSTSEPLPKSVPGT